MRIHPSLRSRAVPLEDLVPLERNPRRGDLASIRESLRVHGQYQPIVVRKETMEILAGNHRFYAAKAEGWDKIAAVIVDVDEEAARRISIVDNRTSDTATYDEELLVALLTELEATETGLAGTGFDEIELAELRADVEVPDFEPISGDEVPRLDTTKPPQVACPECGHQFKVSGHIVK